MKKVLILGQMKDLQSGIYIVETLEAMGKEVSFVDTREICDDKGIVPGQKEIIKTFEELDFEPDLVIILKGLELSPSTLKTIKELYKDAVLTNWYFDIKVASTDIWDNEPFFKVIELYDYFFCSLRGAATKLQDKGFKNVYHVGEACFPPSHEEQNMNYFQKTKYGEDVTFCGTIGYKHIHKDRVRTLSRVLNEGFNMKIWGEIVGEPKTIPLNVRHVMSGTEVINERHAMACQSSLINLGLDAMPELDGSMSARIYRVMCAGGLYLSTATKGIEDFFKVNKKGEEITAEQELVVFYNDDDLVRKLDFLLEHDDIRNSIRLNGQKKVISDHKFSNRLKEIFDLVEERKK